MSVITDRLHGKMKSVTKFFGSVRLAIILLILLGIVSALGTFIPQKRTPSEYQQRYGSSAGILMKLQLTRVYRSVWFLSILLLLILNISVCTLSRLRQKFQRAAGNKLDLQAEGFEKWPFHDEVKMKRSPRDAALLLTNVLRDHGYRFQISGQYELRGIARKKRLGLFGPDLVHVGLILIVLGGLWSGLGRVSHELELFEGQKRIVPGSNIGIRLDDFSTLYYPGGSVKDWKSDLTLFVGSTEMLTSTIEVNHPLRFRGYMFYQSHYGWDWKNAVLVMEVIPRDSLRPPETVRLQQGESRQLFNGEMELSVIRFIPDLILDDRDEFRTGSISPQSPAAYLKVRSGGNVIFEGWKLAQYPEYLREVIVERVGARIEWVDLEAEQFSGIQVNKDDGVHLVWAGCVFLVLGLLLSFFWPFRAIGWVFEPKGEIIEITVGGLNFKSKDLFQKEFQTIIAHLRSFV